jgi:hypothetical protein
MKVSGKGLFGSSGVTVMLAGITLATAIAGVTLATVIAGVTGVMTMAGVTGATVIDGVKGVTVIAGSTVIRGIDVTPAAGIGCAKCAVCVTLFTGVMLSASVDCPPCMTHLAVFMQIWSRFYDNISAEIHGKK